MSETPSNLQAQILCDVWMNYRDDVKFMDFIDENDLGLPLAYALANGIVDFTPKAQGFIEESFGELLNTLGGLEDTGFENLDHLMEAADELEG